MDLSELRDIDSLHIEGTDTLVKGGRDGLSRHGRTNQRH